MSILSPETKKQIGIYGGTFDPIHHGHLILAREALETLKLEKVIFVPAIASPFRDAPMASGPLRLSMLQAAVEGETGFVVDDCELRRPPPSYAIDTAEDILKRTDDITVHYLIGEDNVPTLAKWHRFDELRKLVSFVVLDRTGMEAKHDYSVIHRKIDISATDIRNRVASGRSVRYLVPVEVENIIRRENLYREKYR
jgi:nicotinate-nucleotide adenylyltransferase